MCTVSWTRREDGFALFCNRDERRERGPEIPPALLEVDGSRALAPRDGDFGGTWIWGNEHGLALCLLNGYQDPARAAREYRSRGLLALELAGASDIDEAAERLERAALERYRSFLAVLLEPGREAALFEWDGREPRFDARGDARMPLVSSSFEPAGVRARRAELLRELAGGAPAPSSALLERYHESHAAGPGAYSVCMHRDDAETRSHSRIDVGPESVRLVHVPGPPCRTRPLPALLLARRGAAPARRAAGSTAGARARG